MTNEEKILDTQTKPSEKMDEYPSEKVTKEDLIRYGLIEVDTWSLAQELIRNGDSDVEEIVDSALQSYSADSLVEMAQDCGMELEVTKKFQIRAESGDWIQVNCILCRKGLYEGLEDEIKVYTQIDKDLIDTTISVWACNDCASTNTYRDFEVYFLKNQLPYRIAFKDG